MRKTILIGLLLVPAMILADGTVNYVSGDAYILKGAAKTQLSKGDSVPAGAKVKTGPGGRVSIFDRKTKRTTMVQPNSTITFGKGAGSAAISSIFKKSSASLKSITSVAGVRGKKVTRPCSPKAPYAMSKSRAKNPKLWELYRKADYKGLLKATANAKDVEARFLRAMANYNVYGLDRDGQIMNDLKAVLEDGKATKGLKYDAEQTQGLLSYDKGDYEQAIAIFSKLLDKKDPKKIDEFSYYIMLILNRNMGRDSEEKAVWKHADKHCGKSTLIQSLKLK